MHTVEEEESKKLVAELPDCKLSSRMSKSVTHIVVGSDERRTLKVLRGIALGKWIVTIDWVRDSAKKGKWLPEQSYELEKFSGIAKSRKSHEGGEDTLFHDMTVYLEGATEPPIEELEKMIREAGGTIVDRVSAAEIAIKGKHAMFSMLQDVPVVSAEWVLDSLSKYELLPYKKYIVD